MSNFGQYLTPEQAFELQKESPECRQLSLKELKRMAHSKKRCDVCGQLSWRYADTGLCFTCTTGESDASEDYELEAQ